jgi:hypothetical protein
MSIGTQVMVGTALIIGSGTVCGILGAKLDLPWPITAILAGCLSVLAVHYGFPRA